MRRFMDMFDPESFADFGAGDSKSRVGRRSDAGRRTQWLPDVQRQQQDLLRGLTAALFETLGEFADPGSAAACADRLAGLVCTVTERRLLCSWEFTELIRRTNQEVCAALLRQLDSPPTKSV